ncbi:MAG: phenylalanine--tRNA ligase subunit beta [Magnetococcales bacterium]|nr:phenylalanine--tRNA ligase subunit beta [Magnetococcales bacterium]
MKFTLKWLGDHINTDLSPGVIGDKLTMAGLELDGLTDLAAGLQNVEVGTLTVVEQHPNADRLTSCKVEVGEETLSIVCGAKNHKVGDKVAVARIGAVLPNGMKIKKGKIRGELSEGMLCSVAELGLADEAEGILILPAEAQNGSGVADIIGCSGTLFELDLTPNRGDCLGIRGIARELGVLSKSQLKPLTPVVKVSDDTVAEVEILDGTGCPRYGGRVIRGVKIAPSPSWLKERLESVGLRPINNVVDITNYILMDLNHPLHAFDLAQLKLPIVVRKAKEGEVLTTLDEVKRSLTPEMTLIADQARPLALAGIMGGEESGVSDSTTDIFLEAAYFNPITTARTGRKLTIQSDSRHRFERGVDPLGLELALERATELIIELAGGSAGPINMVDAGTWQKAKPIPFRPERINRLGGINLSQSEMEEMLLGIGCIKTADNSFQPPSHRHDLVIEEDILEEIVRLYGYDKVPSSLPRIAVNVPDVNPDVAINKKIQKSMTALGYFEAINYTFVSPALQNQFDPGVATTALLNPISEEQSVMRTTLVCGLVESARRNLARGNSILKLFEVGRVFRPGSNGDLIEEDRTAALLTGAIGEKSWHTADREVDFFDLKGDLMGLLTGLTAAPCNLEVGGPDFLHPGRKAKVCLGRDKREIGWIGELHPQIQESLDSSSPLFMFELICQHLNSDKDKKSAKKGLETISRYQSVERDFAFLVADDVPAGPFLETILAVDRELIRKVNLFDLYTGEHMQEGEKSLAIKVTMQANDRTLTDSETQKLSEQITKRVSDKFNATQR